MFHTNTACSTLFSNLKAKVIVKNLFFVAIYLFWYVFAFIFVFLFCAIKLY